jgi:hypothetical protein
MEGVQRMWQLKWRNWITGTFFWSSHPHKNMPAEILEEQITINKQHFQKKYMRKPNTGYKQKQLLNIHIYVSVCEHANIAKLKVKTIIRITVAQVAVALSHLVIKIKPCK